MKLSVKKKWGFIHVRGGRILRVAHEHQVPVSTYNASYDQELTNDPTADDHSALGATPFKARSFDSAWVTTQPGDICVEIIARKTDRVLGHAYLSGPAINLIRYTRDIPVFEHWFAAGKGIGLVGFDPANKQTSEYTPERFVSSMMVVKYSDADVAVLHADVATNHDMERCAAALSQSFGYAQIVGEGEPELTPITHVMGAIHCKKEKRHILMHLQPPKHKSDYAAQPFFYELVASSPHLVPHPFWVEMEPEASRPAP